MDVSQVVSPSALVILALVSGVLIGALLMYRLVAWWRRYRLARNRRIGSQGEEQAVAILEGAGYHIISAQSERVARMLVDGESRQYAVRADFVVERQGRRYAAEVKAGEVVRDPVHSDTRRQLLEYRVVFHEMAGVLLVDVPSRSVLKVVFPDLSESSPRSRISWGRLVIAILVGLVVGAAIAIWFIRI